MTTVEDEIEAAREKEYLAALQAEIKFDLESKLAIIRRAGFVVEVRQEPLQPLAMGNYVTVVDVRKSQHIYKNEKS